MAQSFGQKGAKASLASSCKNTSGCKVDKTAASSSASIEDNAQSSSKNDASTAENDRLREKAKLALLREAKRGAERAETMGTQGWRAPSSYATNKRFLSRTLASTVPRSATFNKEQSRKRRRSTSPQERREKESTSRSDEKRSHKNQSSTTDKRK